MAELVQFLGEQAACEPSVLSPSSPTVLLCVVDSSGVKSLSSEVTTAPGKGARGRPTDSERTGDVRKRLERRVAALGLVATDGESDVGRLPTVTRDTDQTATVAGPSDWVARRPAPFDEDPWPFLEQARGTMLGALRQGLRDAAAKRSRPHRRA